MDAFYENVVSVKGAAFFAVCRGKVCMHNPEQCVEEMFVCIILTCGNKSNLLLTTHIHIR